VLNLQVCNGSGRRGVLNGQFFSLRFDSACSNPSRVMRRDLVASEQSAVQANYSAQFNHSADVGGVASEIIIEAVVEFSWQHASGSPPDEVADVVAILGVDDHESLLDQVNDMSSIIEGLNHETITNS